MNRAYLVAIIIIGIAMGFTLWAFSSAMTPYVDIRTARASAAPVQVKGKILHDTVHWDHRLNALCFLIEDKNKDRIEVAYKGPKPDAFDTAPETAADGIVQKDSDGQEIFVSSKMVVKCPSKYDDRAKPPVGNRGQVTGDRTEGEKGRRGEGEHSQQSAIDNRQSTIKSELAVQSKIENRKSKIDRGGVSS